MNKIEALEALFGDDPSKATRIHVDYLDGYIEITPAEAGLFSAETIDRITSFRDDSDFYLSDEYPDDPRNSLLVRLKQQMAARKHDEAATLACQPVVPVPAPIPAPAPTPAGPEPRRVPPRPAPTPIRASIRPDPSADRPDPPATRRPPEADVTRRTERGRPRPDDNRSAPPDRNSGDRSRNDESRPPADPPKPPMDPMTQELRLATRDREWPNYRDAIMKAWEEASSVDATIKMKADKKLVHASSMANAFIQGSNGPHLRMIGRCMQLLLSDLRNRLDVNKPDAFLDRYWPTP